MFVMSNSQISIFNLYYDHKAMSKQKQPRNWMSSSRLVAMYLHIAMHLKRANVFHLSISKLTINPSIMSRWLSSPWKSETASTLCTLMFHKVQKLHQNKSTSNYIVVFGMHLPFLKFLTAKIFLGYYKGKINAEVFYGNRGRTTIIHYLVEPYLTDICRRLEGKYNLL